MKKAMSIVKAITFRGSGLSTEIDIKHPQNFFLLEISGYLDDTLAADAQMLVFCAAGEFPPIMATYEQWK